MAVEGLKPLRGDERDRTTSRYQEVRPRCGGYPCYRACFVFLVVGVGGWLELFHYQAFPIVDPKPPCGVPGVEDRIALGRVEVQGGDGGLAPSPFDRSFGGLESSSIEFERLDGEVAQIEATKLDVEESDVSIRLPERENSLWE